ncbi:MAG: S1 RNA-binding domain-containing protein [Oscillospiraceae bacterium]|jgi:small subunit ribosomal protein S1|nr:S1 RNA-binding domain-containing protein [Oscillospiraceae bacterium]
MKFYPEGFKGTKQNAEMSRYYLITAMEKGWVLEGTAEMLDENKNIQVNLGNGFSGVIEFEDAADGDTSSMSYVKEVFSKVGKTVQFMVKAMTEDGIFLSRREVQERCKREFLDTLRKGDVINAVVTSICDYGVFVDIGGGVVSLLPIANIQFSRTTEIRDIVFVGENLRVIYLGKDGEHYLLSHKEMLGTWVENAERFKEGTAVVGVVSTVEEYGIFVELAPNFVGLLETIDGIKNGDSVSVYIKRIDENKGKVKLALVSKLNTVSSPKPYEYSEKLEWIDVDNWEYYEGVNARKQRMAV